MIAYSYDHIHIRSRAPMETARHTMPMEGWYIIALSRAPCLPLALYAGRLGPSMIGRRDSPPVGS